MTPRRIIVSFGMLVAVVGAVLLLIAPGENVKQSSVRLPPSGVPASSFDFSYSSHSYFNPQLPGKNSGGGLTITCEAQGLLHFVSRGTQELTLLIEFTAVLCAGTDVITERGLLRKVQYSREFLASMEAVHRASEDPALAIARSLFLHSDGALRTEWPGPEEGLVQRELRLEGAVSPVVKAVSEQDAVRWTKAFAGTLSAETIQTGMVQRLEYEVKARSTRTQPVELGLQDLQGHEQSSSLQGKHLVARTDIHIHMRRREAWKAELLTEMLASTQADVPAAAPKILAPEERQELVNRWRQFRDGDGQRPVMGETDSNQETYLELKRALRQDPELAEELAVDLEAMAPESSAFATLAGALIYSGEESALNAFVEQAVAHRDEVAWQQRALPMVGLAPVPTEASWNYLDAMRKQSRELELSTAAELGMATHLKRGYADPNFVSELEQRLASASTEAERLHLLDLIGNAGLDQFFPIITSWLSGGSLTLRLRIVQALRFMPRAEAESLLLQLASDSQIDLAVTALTSLQERTLTAASLPQLLQILRSTADDRIRLKVLENLYAARQLDAKLLDKVRSIRSTLNLEPSLAEAWNQIEEDWVDPVET